jgi:hypothetical protein
MTRHPIHLTERGEWVKTIIEGILAIIVLPVAGAVIVYTAVGK